MTELRDILRASDPVTRDAGLSNEDTERMRRAVLASRGAADARARRVPGAGWLAAMAAIACAGVWVVNVAESRTAHVAAVTPVRAPMLPVVQQPSRRQFQFSTPGGTRVIWITDSEFDLR